MRYREKEVEIPIWGGSLKFIDSNDKKLVIENTDIPEDIIEDTFGYALRKNKSKYIVLLDTTSNEMCIPILVHEASHIVNYIFEDRGVLLDYSNDESYAYTIEWVVREALKFYKNICII